MIKKRNIFFFIILGYLLVNSCKQKKDNEVIQDITITPITSFNNLFFDSVQLDHFIQADSTLIDLKDEFFNFYKQRNYELAWFDTSGISEHAFNFYNLLGATAAELQDNTLLDAKFQLQLQNLNNNHKKLFFKKDILRTELLLTSQFFKYASKVYTGQDIDAVKLGWFIPTKKIELSKLLDTVIATKAKNPVIYIPFNSQYGKLQKQFLFYYQLQKKYPEDTIAYLKNYPSINNESPIISSIKYRLFLLRDIAYFDSAQLFDIELLNAIQQFQERHGLPKSRNINNNFIAELNKPIKKRIEQILINLERARWLPVEKDSNYFLVNIPEFKLHVFDSAVNTWDMNVIVGKTATSTVIFNGNLKYVVFSPYWNIPSNITKNEILPNIEKDRNYLAKNNMEQYGMSEGLPMFRQKSGPTNALGLVKFLFPNSYDIYFHDTPNKNYFNTNNRSLSHGCIRLSEPKKLASYLLRNDTTITENVMDSLMHLPKEKWISVKKAVPVFIVYFTSWVDKNGLLNFRNDIYGHDEKMSLKMFVH